MMGRQAGKWHRAGVGALVVCVLLALCSTYARAQTRIEARVGEIVGRASVTVTARSVEDTVPLFATPRDTSPHFDFIRRTFTDFCYCWSDPADRAYAARIYDLIMSGNLEAWKALNPTSTRLRYVLVQTTFTEEPDTTSRHFVDADNITGKWQYDARAWYAAHPQYNYESLYLHDLSPTPTDSASRLRWVIWNNYRYGVNPFDAGARAYTIDRLRRALADVPAATGLFLDEMDHNAWKRVGISREAAGMDSTAWHAVVVSFVKEIHDSLGVMLQSNAAEYSPGQFDRAIGVAAGAMHLERMNKATQDMANTWRFVDSLVALGVYVDMVNLEDHNDFPRYEASGKYPKGNYQDGLGRGKAFQLASYYMVVDSGAKLVGLQSDNIRGPTTPKDVDLRIYYLDVGYPKAPRYVWQTGKDALGQTATVWRRDFSNAVVLTRPIPSYKPPPGYSLPQTTDTTAVNVALPDGGPWALVQARGQIVPIDSLQLRNSEAVFLIRRP